MTRTEIVRSFAVLEKGKGLALKQGGNGHIPVSDLGKGKRVRERQKKKKELIPMLTSPSNPIREGEGRHR